MMQEPFVAEIRLFSYNVPPAGWLPCDGRLLDIAMHQPLFSILGWRAHAVDSLTDFAIPRITEREPLTFAIAATGLYPAHSGEGRMDEPYIGEIRLFGGTYAPNGWRICDGSALPVAAYRELFEVIGNSFGGDAATFHLPDLRERPAAPGLCFIIALTGVHPAGGSADEAFVSCAP